MLDFLRNLLGKAPAPAKPAAPSPKAPAAPPPVPARNLSEAGRLIPGSEAIDFDTAAQSELLEFMAREATLALTPLLHNDAFRGNPWCSPADAAAIFAMLAKHDCTRVMEVGSGYSTMALRHTLKARNLPAELISIDPEPRADIGEFVDAQLFHPVQDVPVDDFKLMQRNEVILFDTTHIDAPGSDVAWVFDQILPQLAPGVLVGFHQIALPREYAREGLAQGWNEQHRLLAFLAKHRGRVEVLFAGAWLREHKPEALTASLPPGSDPNGATAFWFRVL